MSLRNATPFSRSCSIGTVINCSTSGAESPSASVCTSTVVGPNSGRTSTDICRSWVIPTTSSTAAAATIKPRKRRLDPMIERIIVGRLLGYAFPRRRPKASSTLSSKVRAGSVSRGECRGSAGASVRYASSRR
jgi:hypothetical protein